MKNQGRGANRNSGETGGASTGSDQIGKQQSNSSMNTSAMGSDADTKREMDHEMGASDFHVPGALAQALPRESRENIERVLNGSRDFIRESRTYVRENPREAAGLFVVAGMIFWALFGTKPGRRVVSMGSAYATPLLSQWINSNLNFSGGTGNFNRGSMH